jgi:hypothetical protein
MSMVTSGVSGDPRLDDYTEYLFVRTAKIALGRKIKQNFQALKM